MEGFGGEFLHRKSLAHFWPAWFGTPPHQTGTNHPFFDQEAENIIPEGHATLRRQAVRAW